MKRNDWVTLCSMAIAASVYASPESEQATVDNMSSGLAITYEIQTNQGASDGLACQDLGAEWASCNKINMKLINSGSDITSKDWKIYFHSIRQILKVDNDQYRISHVTGDLHTLEPTDRFIGIKAGETVTIPYIGEYWTLFESDFMPRPYVVSGTSSAKIIKANNTEDLSKFVAPLNEKQLKRTADDNNIVATASTRFDKNSDVTVLSSDKIASHCIPQPASIKTTGGKVSLKNGISLSFGSLPSDMSLAIQQRLKQVGVKTSGNYPVDISIKPETFTGTSKVAGAYTLEITPSKTTIVGFDNSGAFYGIQSLISVIPQGAGTDIPTLSISDMPRMGYRAFMVDVARNFHSKEAILKTIDQMSAYKMNILHLHLSDDEGWRLEIPGLPELTTVGGKRGHDLSETTALLPQLGSGPNSDNSGTGFFSRTQYIEILKYAKARGIEVIPELDMPAHARAAVVSMEARFKKLSAAGDTKGASEYRLMDPDDQSNVTTVQFYDKRSFINPCLPSSIKFVDKVISEVAAMHKEAGAPLTTWHFGGDEAKNIKRGGGFQDHSATEKVAWKGTIDLSAQDVPFGKSPVCQKAIQDGVVKNYEQLPSYFAEQVSKIVAKNGIQVFQAWEDGLKNSKDSSAFATKDVRVNFWDPLFWGGAATAYDIAKKGYKVVVSNPDYLYLDFPYEVDPKEPGYYWATRATDTRKIFSFAPVNLPQNAETSVDRDGNGFKSSATAESAKIYGMSTQIWSETVRSDEEYEYKVFPRLIASAERAWHRADWEKDYRSGVEYSQATNMVNKTALTTDWELFANTMGQRELAKMDVAGIKYRIPVPGAKVVNGQLAMNSSFPGLKLQYSTDNGKNWSTYNDATRPAATGTIVIRAVSPDGKRFSRVTGLGFETVKLTVAQEVVPALPVSAPVEQKTTFFSGSSINGGFFMMGRDRCRVNDDDIYVSNLAHITTLSSLGLKSREYGKTFSYELGMHAAMDFGSVSEASQENEFSFAGKSWSHNFPDKKPHNGVSLNKAVANFKTPFGLSLSGGLGQFGVEGVLGVNWSYFPGSYTGGLAAMNFADKVKLSYAIVNKYKAPWFQRLNGFSAQNPWDANVDADSNEIKYLQGVSLKATFNDKIDFTASAGNSEGYMMAYFGKLGLHFPILDGFNASYQFYGSQNFESWNDQANSYDGMAQYHAVTTDLKQNLWNFRLEGTYVNADGKLGNYIPRLTRGYSGSQGGLQVWWDLRSDWNGDNEKAVFTSVSRKFDDILGVPGWSVGVGGAYGWGITYEPSNLSDGEEYAVKGDLSYTTDIGKFKGASFGLHYVQYTNKQDELGNWTFPNMFRSERDFMVKAVIPFGMSIK